MTDQEFYDNCNEEIMRCIKEGVKEYEREKKERIYNRFKTVSDERLIINVVQAYKLVYEVNPSEWDACVKAYIGTPTGSVLRYVSNLFHIIEEMKYTDKRDVFYHICKIIGGDQ